VLLGRASGLLLAAACCAAALGPARAETLRDGRPAMGTVLEIELVSEDAARARAALEACFAEVRALEALVSHWDPASALSELNRAAGGTPRPVPPGLARILADAATLARRSEGSFDPTVGPLVSLWREAREAGRLPAPERLGEARARVGFAGIEVEGLRARLARPGMSVDLGGFAKGWALDRLGELLARHGIERALLSFGQSSLLALGAPEDAPAWRVLVRDPRGGFAGVASLRDASLSVSESFGESAEVAGRRLGHLIDPRSGEPLDRAAGAVVVAPSGAAAEAWSKAVLVLPAERAFLLLAAEPGVEALLLDPAGGRRSTRGFDAAVAFAGLP
jgi:thiamine biosynthesis lipoprotein